MSAETDPVPMSAYPDHLDLDAIAERWERGEMDTAGPALAHADVADLMAEVRDLRAVRDAARRLLDRTENNELFAREAEALAEALTRLEAGRG